MKRFEALAKTFRALGLWAGILTCLVVALWGGRLPGGHPDWGTGRPAAQPDRLQSMPFLHLAVAEASGLGATGLRSPDLQATGPSRMSGEPAVRAVRVAANPLGEMSGDIPVPLEDGREPRPPSAIPLPPVLPSPRIDIPVTPDGGSPVPEGWSLKEFAGKGKIKVEKVGPLFAIHLNSDRASFGLHKDITVDVSQYPYLSWAWRVDQLPPKGDVRRKDTDDQAAQLYVVFPRFPAMVRSQIIGYVWDSTAPAGTVLNSPSNRMAKIIVLRSGADRLGQWVLESRNVLEDFRRLFGDPPPKVGKLSLLINSQNTKSSAESWFAGLVFTRTPLARDTGMSADLPPSRAERASGPGRLERVN